jgi:predicted DNA-binding WGR domain protein
MTTTIIWSNKRKRDQITHTWGKIGRMGRYQPEQSRFEDQYQRDVSSALSKVS